jgi:biofilm PGA synthesis N-glycosyltransferase PgaC
LSPASRQAIVQGGALGWAVGCVAVGALVARGAAGLITWPAVVVLLILLVGLPGGLAARRLLALLLADQPAVAHVRPVTPVTVLLPAADPATTTAVLVSLAHQDHDGPVRVVTVATSDPGPTRVAALAARDLGLTFDVIPPGPQAAADWRNTALMGIATPLVLSLAPRAYLHPSALRLLVARLESCPPATVGVAGHLLVRNPRRTTGAEALARAWTFELDARQRAEALLCGPLVADGSCTLLRTDALRAINGWPTVEPRDVTVTWRCLERGWTTTSEPQALAFTVAPVTSATPGRARAVAARVVRSAARESGGPPRLAPRPSRVSARVDRARPAFDVVCSLAWVAALALAGFGRLGLVVAYLLLVAPVSLAGLAVERRHHRERLDEAGLTLANPPQRWRAVLCTLDPVQAVLGVWGLLTPPRP